MALGTLMLLDLYDLSFGVNCLVKHHEETEVLKIHNYPNLNVTAILSSLDLPM